MKMIALADDNLRIRGGISHFIQQLPDYKVFIEATNGFDLVKQIQFSKKLPGIIVVDVQMPIMDGLSATDFIHSRYPEISILAISNHTHYDTVQKMIEAGAKGYIIKMNLSASILSKAFSAITNGDIFIDHCLGDKKNFESAADLPMNFISSFHPDITEKEKTFLQLAATAITYDQIAELMNVAKESVYNYQKNLREKLGISTRQELMLYAIQHGIAKVARYHNYFPEKANARD